MARVTALSNLSHGGKVYTAGEVLEVSDELATSLVERGLAAEGGEVEEQAPAPAENSAQAEAPASGDDTFNEGAAEGQAEPTAPEASQDAEQTTPEVAAEPQATQPEAPASTNSNVLPQAVPVNVVKG